MTSNRNPLLKKAFEEAAEAEINSLSDENQTVRAYSQKHIQKMEKLFKSEGREKKVFRFKRSVAACIAAVLVLLVTVTASAGFLDLFDPDNFDNNRFTHTLWNIDDSYTVGEGADEFTEITYNGKPITINYSLSTGINSDFPERALVVLINGVRQSFDAVLGDNTYENTDILYLERGLGTVQTATLTLQPNMGKKGEVLALEVSAIFDPDQNFYPECEGLNGLIGAHTDDDNDKICDKCSINLQNVPVGPQALTFTNEAFAKIVMKKNAPKSEDNICESFSGYTEDTLHKKIYDCFNYEIYGSNGTEIANEYYSLETLCAKFYRDIDESLEYDENGGILSDTLFRTTAKKDDKFTINLHGKSGNYRVAFYIGTEAQPVFDGKDYVDVEIKDGKQVELEISLDTTLLNGKNKFYIVYKHIDDNLFEDYWWFSQQICEGTIIVE